MNKKFPIEIRVCISPKMCTIRDSKMILRVAREEVRRLEAEEFIIVDEANCLGRCKFGPNVNQYDADGNLEKRYEGMNSEKMKLLIAEFIQKLR